MNTQTKHVLIIEDEPDIREAMAEAVASAGYQTSTANNGEEGLAMAFEQHPDLILLDLVMPVMDGRQALKKLREDPWGKDARVVVLTSMDDVENIASSHEYTIEDYIIKSHASLDEILQKVRLALHASEH